mgnify:CR=1 FL=1
MSAGVDDDGVVNVSVAFGRVVGASSGYLEYHGVSENTFSLSFVSCFTHMQYAVSFVILHTSSTEPLQIGMHMESISAEESQ